MSFREFSAETRPDELVVEVGWILRAVVARSQRPDASQVQVKSGLSNEQLSEDFKKNVANEHITNMSYRASPRHKPNTMSNKGSHITLAFVLILIDSFSSDLTLPAIYSLLWTTTATHNRPRRAAILSAEAKGVAGLGKAGGDSQGGSDKAGQQVPPEVYNALTYAGSAFLFTLSVPLILYGLNKLLNKIEDCFGCGPSSKSKSKVKQQAQQKQKKQRQQQTISVVGSAKPVQHWNHSTSHLDRRFDKSDANNNNSSCKIVSVSSDDDAELQMHNTSGHRHTTTSQQQRLHEAYSNHQSQLFTAAINGSIDMMTAGPANNANNNLNNNSFPHTPPTDACANEPAPQASSPHNHSHNHNQNQSSPAMPFETHLTGPFAMDIGLKKQQISANNDTQMTMAHNGSPQLMQPSALDHTSHQHQHQQSNHQAIQQAQQSPQQCDNLAANNLARVYQDTAVNIQHGFKTAPQQQHPYIMSSCSPKQL